MTRREAGEQLYREKFTQYGLDTMFEFMHRDWASDHGRRMFVKCKHCGKVFTSWDEVFKGRQSAMYCPSCGASSDGNDRFTRTAAFKEMREFYETGHTVTETAEKFQTDRSHVNNYAKQYHWHNGKTWREAAQEHNERIRIGFTPKYKVGGNLKARAKRHGAKVIDQGITPQSIFKKYEGRCCICGKQCSLEDKRWGSFGPDYPTRGHIVPSCEHGDISWKNIWLLCGECNVKLGSEDERHYLEEGDWQWNEKQKKYVRGWLQN